jgi:hypothetical protein
MKEKLVSFGCGVTLETALAKRAFTVDSYQPSDPIYFGNAMLLVSNSEARLRFVRDRGSDFVDFGPIVGGDWFGLRHIIKLVAPTLLWEDGIRLRYTLEDSVARLLDSHWSRVIALFQEDSLSGTRSAIDSLKRTELAEFLKTRGRPT